MSMKRQKFLTELLNKAARDYYNGGTSDMMDYEYDNLYDELAELENINGCVLSGSPTTFAGYESLSGFPKKSHKHPALSLEKTKAPEAIMSFLGEEAGVISWKLDGLTMVLTYDENGKLESAVTRGDGYIGDDITASARHIHGIPLQLPCKGRKIVRGEAVITYSDFNRINNTIADTAEKYKNPRNLAAGSLRLTSMKELAERNVRFIVFLCTEGFEKFSTVGDQLDYCSEIGFEVVPHLLVSASSVNKVLFDKEEQVNNFEYPVDGMVITFDNVNYGNSLCATGKYHKNAIAFKWRDTVEKTTLRAIEWQIGKTGAYTPVAVFDPVELEGTTVTRASVHNKDILDKFRLTVGDCIGVYKANMIIPQIAKNYDWDKHEDYAAPMPPQNPENDKRQIDIRRLTHFADREAINISGVAESIITALYDAELLKKYSDFYTLSLKSENKIISATNLSYDGLDKLLAAIEKSRTTTPDKFLYALSIPLVGRSASKDICRYIKGDVNKLTESQVISGIISIPDVGEAMQRSLEKYFESGSETATEFLSVCGFMKFENNFADEIVQPDNGIKGKTFVITGSVTHYKNRDELKNEIERLGGKVASSVSKNTHFLINNDVSSASGKNAKAKALGISIISENDYIAMKGVV